MPKVWEKEKHFKEVCKSGGGSDKRDHSKQRPKKGKGKRFHEINESGEGVMDDLTEQVQSLFYNDMSISIQSVPECTPL